MPRIYSPPPPLEPPGHTPLVIDPSRIRVVHIAEVPRKSANPNAITRATIGLDEPPPPDARRHYFVAKYLDYPNEYRGETQQEARESLQVLWPRSCAPGCPACAARGREEFADHEASFGPYLGSLGGLDTEFVERQPYSDPGPIAPTTFNPRRYGPR